MSKKITSKSCGASASIPREMRTLAARIAAKSGRSCADIIGAYRRLARGGRVSAAELGICAASKWRGTSEEVRDASVMPWIREDLALTLRNTMKIYAIGEDRRTVAARQRRDALMRSNSVCVSRFGCMFGATVEQQLMLGAAARAMGVSVEKFVGEWIATGIDAVRDQMPNGEIPLNRHELAALAKIKSAAK